MCSDFGALILQILTAAMAQRVANTEANTDSTTVQWDKFSLLCWLSVGCNLPFIWLQGFWQYKRGSRI